MEKEWLLSEAKNKFTEVVNMALIAPQTVKRRNDTVIVLSLEEYNRLLGEDKGFKHHLFSAPDSLADLDMSCDIPPKSENKNFLQSMVGKSTVNMSTDEIMKLTRD